MGINRIFTEMIHCLLLLLAALPYVDAGRIGCFGWSMGAHRAWLLAAFCPVVKTGVALCWMTLKRTQAQPPIARWLCPKPFLFLNGRSDRLFPASASQEAFERMQAIYAEAGTPSLLRTEWFDGGHHCGLHEQETILQFFRQQLLDAPDGLPPFPDDPFQGLLLLHVAAVGL